MCWKARKLFWIGIAAHRRIRFIILLTQSKSDRLEHFLYLPRRRVSTTTMVLPIVTMTIVKESVLGSFSTCISKELVIVDVNVSCFSTTNISKSNLHSGPIQRKTRIKWFCMESNLATRICGASLTGMRELMLTLAWTGWWIAPIAIPMTSDGFIAAVNYLRSRIVGSMVFSSGEEVPPSWLWADTWISETKKIHWMPICFVSWDTTSLECVSSVQANLLTTALTLWWSASQNICGMCFRLTTIFTVQNTHIN